MRYEITPTARRDLAEIDDYTANRWGEAQAAHYIAKLFDAFGKLASAPQLGRQHADAPRALRAYRVAQHLVFYRPRDECRVEIIRVLHVAMDIAARLRELKR